MVTESLDRLGVCNRLNLLLDPLRSGTSCSR